MGKTPPTFYVLCKDLFRNGRNTQLTFQEWHSKYQRDHVLNFDIHLGQHFHINFTKYNWFFVKIWSPPHKDTGKLSVPSISKEFLVLCKTTPGGQSGQLVHTRRKIVKGDVAEWDEIVNERAFLSSCHTVILPD